MAKTFSLCTFAKSLHIYHVEAKLIVEIDFIALMINVIVFETYQRLPATNGAITEKTNIR